MKDDAGGGADADAGDVGNVISDGEDMDRLKPSSIKSSSDSFTTTGRCQSS